MKTSVLLVALLFFGQAHAQLRKCTGPDGKVTYSDVVCAGGSATTNIKTPAVNTLDMSGMRKQSEAQRAQESQVTRSPAPLQDCKFEYYSVGDEKGKQLAANAKAECLQNNEARANGGPTSLEHYNFWKDHRAIKTGQRQAAIAEGNANARAAQRSIDKIKIDPPAKQLTCRPNLMKTELVCE